MDGLAMAVNLLEKDFEVTRLNLQESSNQSKTPLVDFVLGWGAFGSPVDQWLQTYSVPWKKGLCVAGNSLPPINPDTYSILFCETDYVKDVYLRGIKSKKVKAFGVNTDIFFKSDFPSAIVWDYIGVGSFSSWKRWEKMRDKKGSRLVVGEYQTNNEYESLTIIRDLVQSGVMVSDMVSPFDLSNLYQWSRTAYIPADINGGGERAVLEARACGIQVEVEDDNPKLKELLEIPVPSHVDYYKSLRDGIFSIL